MYLEGSWLLYQFRKIVVDFPAGYMVKFTVLDMTFLLLCLNFIQKAVVNIPLGMSFSVCHCHLLDMQLWKTADNLPPPAIGLLGTFGHY